jgi:hypothetical protein
VDKNSLPGTTAPTIHPRDLPLDVVREMARDRTERTSIRQVASEMTIGASTLHNFLRGAEPHPRVRRVLAEWYSRETTKRGAEYHDSAYTSALQVLLGALPNDRRATAADDVLSAIEQAHLRNGTPLPWWLRRLRAAAAEKHSEP